MAPDISSVVDFFKFQYSYCLVPRSTAPATTRRIALGYHWHTLKSMWDWTIHLSGTITAITTRDRHTTCAGSSDSDTPHVPQQIQSLQHGGSGCNSARDAVESPSTR